MLLEAWMGLGRSKGESSVTCVAAFDGLAAVRPTLTLPTASPVRSFYSAYTVPELKNQNKVGPVFNAESNI